MIVFEISKKYGFLMSEILQLKLKCRQDLVGKETS